MKKALIIGIDGFVGNYLSKHIQENYGWLLFGTKRKSKELDIPNAVVYTVDILEEKKIEAVLNEIKPDYVFFLAAQSSVALSWQEPQLTVDVNIKGSINVLEAIKKMEHKPKLLLVGSSEEYGRITEKECPINESNLVRPMNIYAATKVFQNMAGKIYSDAYGLKIISVRAFNHMGPGQSDVFVTADFCKQVAEIEKGIRNPIILTGDLSAKRDFTDVRDIVKAYCLLMEDGVPGETYNVGSGKERTIEEILRMIISQSFIDNIKITVDFKKIRPIEAPIIKADIKKIKEHTGWKREISIEKTIEDTLTYWRRKIDREIN